MNEIKALDLRETKASPELHKADTPGKNHHVENLVFCRECGFKLLAGSKFCTKCGAKVGG